MTATGLLQVALIILKILDFINWPWVWVLAPSWLTIIGVLVVFILNVIFHD